MELQTFTTKNLGTSGKRDAILHAAASAEEKIYFPHPDVPILDVNPDDEFFEPDGVNDFVRDFGSWNPDREF